MSTRTAPWIPLLCLSLSGFAQQSPSPDQRMTLDVAVTDKSGKPVTGLEQKDFSVLDNKQPQKIESFAGATAAEPAVQFIFVSDEVNTSFSNVSYERAQIEKFLRSNSGKLPLPASLAFVSDAGLKLDSVTTEDGNALATELAKNQNGLRSINRDQGVYGAGERVEISLNALRQLIAYETPRPGRKLVIWLGPGWPFLTGPNINLSDNDQKGIFGQVVAISDGLRRARMTLYSVDPLGTNDAGSARTFYYREFVSGVKNAGHAQYGNLALQAIAIQSGGLALNSDNDIAGELARCVADSSGFYTLTFDTLPGDGPNEYHALQIKLDQKGLVARTRNGYYAQPVR